MMEKEKWEMPREVETNASGTVEKGTKRKTKERCAVRKQGSQLATRNEYRGSLKGNGANAAA